MMDFIPTLPLIGRSPRMGMGGVRPIASGPVPVFDQTADSGTVTPIPWFNSGGSGTLKITYDRPAVSAADYICSFKAGATHVGPLVYDLNGASVVLRHRTNAAADVINNDFALTGTTHSIVIAWDAGTGPDRQSVWYNGVLEAPDVDVTGTALGDAQDTLVWGASGMTNVRIQYWNTRLTSPP